MACHDDGGAFVDADAQKLRIAFDQRGHVGEALSLGEVLIDGGTRQEAQAALVAFGHDVAIAERIGAGQVLGLNRGAGAAAHDDSAAPEHVAHRRVGFGIEIGVGEAPLPPAAEPDAAGGAERLEILGAVDLGQLAAGQDGDRFGAGLTKLLGDAALFRNGIGHSGRQHNDPGFLSAGQLNEPFDDPLGHATAADDDQRAFFHLRRSRLGRRKIAIDSLAGRTTQSGQVGEDTRSVEHDFFRLARSVTGGEVNSHAARTDAAHPPAAHEQRGVGVDFVTDQTGLLLEQLGQRCGIILGRRN